MIEVTQPYKGTARIKFSTGLQVDIIDQTQADDRPRLYIKAAGHDQDLDREAILVWLMSSNTISLLFFDEFELQ